LSPQDTLVGYGSCQQYVIPLGGIQVAMWPLWSLCIFISWRHATSSLPSYYNIAIINSVASDPRYLATM
jgi:hypothetical protein